MSPKVGCRCLVLSMNLKSACWVDFIDNKCSVDSVACPSFCLSTCLSLAYLGQSNRKWWTVSTWSSLHWRQHGVALFLILCRCLLSRMWLVQSWTYIAVCFFLRWPASFRKDLVICLGSSALMWGCRGEVCHSCCHLFWRWLLFAKPDIVHGGVTNLASRFAIQRTRIAMYTPPLHPVSLSYPQCNDGNWWNLRRALRHRARSPPFRCKLMHATSSSKANAFP